MPLKRMSKDIVLMIQVQVVTSALPPHAHAYLILLTGQGHETLYMATGDSLADQ